MLKYAIARYFVLLLGLAPSLPCQAIEDLRWHGKVGYSKDIPNFEYGSGVSYKGILFCWFERPELSSGYEIGYFYALRGLFSSRLNNGFYGLYGFETYKSPAASKRSYFVDGPEKFNARHIRVGAVLFDFLDISVRQINRDIESPVIYDRGESQLEKSDLGYFIGLGMVINQK